MKPNQKLITILGEREDTTIAELVMKMFSSHRPPYKISGQASLGDLQTALIRRLQYNPIQVIPKKFLNRNLDNLLSVVENDSRGKLYLVEDDIVYQSPEKAREAYSNT